MQSEAIIVAGWSVVPGPIHRLIRRLVPNGRLTPRDQKVLMALDRAGTLTQADLIRGCFPGHAPYARQRLELLRQRHLITIHRDGWTLLAQGREVVQALNFLEQPEKQ